MENVLCDIKVINAIRNKYGFSFSKSLGQNFLIDPEIPREIVRQSEIDKKTGVIEIGPGFGPLTYELCSAAARVVAVEIDRSLIPVLDDTVGHFENLKVVNADFLKIDAASLIEEEFTSRGIDRVVVCANLPYYITTPIIMGLLEKKLPLERITVMVQKEVAERLCTDKPSRDMGAVTLAVQYRARTEILFPVGREKFMPVPKVDSAVISLIPLEKPPVQPKNERFMFTLIKAAYSQRRKTLVNAVAGVCGKETTASALRQLGLSADIRAERMSLEDFCNLSNILK